MLRGLFKMSFVYVRLCKELFVMGIILVYSTDIEDIVNGISSQYAFGPVWRIPIPDDEHNILNYADRVAFGQFVRRKFGLQNSLQRVSR